MHMPNQSYTPSDLLAQEPFIGRWDLTLQTPAGPLAAWLEVRRSGYTTLVGQFVGSHGSARPISRVQVNQGVLRFAIPPQWERGDGDLILEGSFQDGDLSGSITLPDHQHQPWSACRAPSLIRQSPPVWGEPQSLFNGVDLSGWEIVQGESTWQAGDGILSNPRPGGNLITRQLFTDFQLHLEFRIPPGGNSGVYLRGRYEVQIIDKPSPEPASDLLGAVYGFLPPNQVVPAPPNQWHGLDITLVGRSVTVAVNGVIVISNCQIPGITGGALDSDEAAPGPIFLQGDHGPVDFRNLILTPGVV
jgi:hypothetical protein